MRILIACDEDGKWYVRRIRNLVHAVTSDEHVYYCDKPLANGLSSLEEAFSSAKLMMSKGEIND